MKIQSSQYIYFKSLDPGDVAMDENGMVMMRLEDKTELGYNVVYLDNGSLDSFDDFDHIYHIGYIMKIVE